MSSNIVMNDGKLHVPLVLVDPFGDHLYCGNCTRLGYGPEGYVGYCSRYDEYLSIEKIILRTNKKALIDSVEEQIKTNELYSHIRIEPMNTSIIGSNIPVMCIDPNSAGYLEEYYDIIYFMYN